MHQQVLGRTLPLNGAGVCGAALADLGLPVELLRGFALLARAAGLLGQLAEERRRPIGMDVYLAVDRNAEYVDPHVLTRRQEAADMAAARRRHRLDAPPVLLPGEHRDRRRRARRSPTSGWPRSSAFRETLTRAAARRAGDGRQRPLPPAVAGQHAAVPRRQGAVLRRQLVQRGARVRPAADAGSTATRSCPRTSCASGLDAGFDLAFSNELRIDHSDHLPDHHAAAAGRPADRADLHQHLRAAAAPAEAVRRAGPRDPRARRVVAERPAGRHHRHRPPVARARRPAPVRPARPRPRVRPAGGASGSPTATSTAACAR